MIYFTKPKRHVNRVFIHCSASDNPEHDDVAVMRRWHLARGWLDVGYHYFIRKDGICQVGRDIERTPAAQSGNNTGTIAICLHGLDINKFTAAQLNMLKRLCVIIENSYGSKVLTYHGHREVANKACPVFDYKKVLRLDSVGYLGIIDLKDKLVEPIKPEKFAHIKLAELSIGVRHPHVKILQVLLGGLEIDGVLGDLTAERLILFKKARGYYKSAVVNNYVWQALLDDLSVDL